MLRPEPQEKEIKRAKNVAYRFLSLRPRSRAEVKKKLAGADFSDTVVQAVLADLDRFGYVNDVEFARLWSGSRIRLRGFGMRRIEQELNARGISRETIRECLSRAFQDSPEIDIARGEAEKKLRSLARYAPEVRKKRLAGFLERKGFSPGIIHRLLVQEKIAGDYDVSCLRLQI